MSQVPVFLLLSLPLIGAFAMFALGIVVIHQSSRVLNLAHGAMAMLPAYVAFELSRRGVPVGVALIAGIAAGAAIGVGTERVFVRPLRRQGPTAQTVGTIAALGLILGFVLKVWGSTPRTAPAIFPQGGIHVGSSILRWGQIGLLGVAVAASAAFFVVFRFTGVGLAMRGAASNRRGAALVGVDPDRTASVAWALGGALAALGGILLAAVTILEPVNLTLLVLPAFVAALIGGLSSPAGALGGAVVVGVAQGMVPAIGLIPGVGGFATQIGAPQLVLTILALVVMVLRGDRFSVAAAPEETAPAVVVDSAEPGEEPRRTPRVARTLIGAMLAAGILVWPLLGAPFSIVGDAIQACIFTLIASSLVLLTGWVGQISLAQAAFVGIGAFVSALATRHLGLQFPLNLPVAAAVAAAVAALLGLVALRVRGLYLAVATLIFLWMSNEYLFRTSWLVGPGGGTAIKVKQIGRHGAFPFFDFSERRTFYYVALAAAAATVWALANLRDSKTGRAFFAVRGSETAAASLGIDVRRYKLLAFAISGLIAGLAGNLLIVGQGSGSSTQFGFKESLLFLSIAVVGGLSSLGGAVAAAVVFAGITEVFYRFTALAGWIDLVSAGLLAGVLLAYPGGLGAIPASLGLRRRRSRPVRVAHRAPEPLVTPVAPALPPASEPELALQVDSVTIRFGGVTALSDVTLRARAGRITGLIGPNGAGKTTLFNAISGLVAPSAGTVRLFGTDATAMAVHERAALGVARTFQVIQLFEGLTVFDNLLVATHGANQTGVLAHVAVTKPSLVAEHAARERVERVVERLGLSPIAHRPVAGLPFGTLRMVELARAIVTGAKLVMLDEPASGLDNNETERLASLLLEIRDSLGIAILLIEHDVQMVARVSDYVYVIDRGRSLAEGPPAAIRQNRLVLAAYLGEPSEAIRSVS